MWASALSIGASLIALVVKWCGGSSAPTAGDQKAADEAAALKGAKIIIDQSAAPQSDGATKKALDDGKF